MTVDVEGYFQVAALSQQIRREDWDSHPCRVERNVDRILGLFSESGVSATFFTLGWIAERYLRGVRQIVDGGHARSEETRGGEEGFSKLGSRWLRYAQKTKKP